VICLQDEWKGQVWFTVPEMARREVLYRIIAGGFRVGGVESPKKLNVCILALEAKPVTVVGKEVGTTGRTEFVLVLFNALGNDNTVC